MDILANYFLISQLPLFDNTTKKLFPPLKKKWWPIKRLFLAPKTSDGPLEGCPRHQNKVMAHQKAVKKVMAVHFAIKRPDLPSDWPLPLILPAIFAFLVDFLVCFLLFYVGFVYSFIFAFLGVYLRFFCMFFTLLFSLFLVVYLHFFGMFFTVLCSLFFGGIFMLFL